MRRTIRRTRQVHQFRQLRMMIAALAVAMVALLAVPAGTAVAYPPNPPSAGDSYNQLAALRVAAPLSMDGYSRDRFPHWIDQGNSCNTRERVLIRDGSGVSVGPDCYPTSGSWYSLYDRVWITAPSQVSVDHMVPLANAWRSGAKHWSDSRRQGFANDLSRGQLVPVTVSSNSAKGDRDPSQWRPSNTNWWCYYVRHWINVKSAYGLTVTSAEKSALYDMMGSC